MYNGSMKAPWIAHWTSVLAHILHSVGAEIQLVDGRPDTYVATYRMLGTITQAVIAFRESLPLDDPRPRGCFYIAYVVLPDQLVGDAKRVSTVAGLIPVAPRWICDLGIDVDAYIGRLLWEEANLDISAKYLRREAKFWDDFDGSASASDMDLNVVVDNWRMNSRQRGLLVVGDRGMGKTWFAVHYAARLARRFLVESYRTPLPLLLYLRALRGRYFLEEAIQSQCGDWDVKLPLGSQGWTALLHSGAALGLLDGLDESFYGTGLGTVDAQFLHLRSVLGGVGRAIVTCRRSYFRSDLELRRATSGRGEEWAVHATELGGVTVGPPAEGGFAVAEISRLDDVTVRAQVVLPSFAGSASDAARLASIPVFFASLRDARSSIGGPGIAKWIVDVARELVLDSVVTERSFLQSEEQLWDFVEELALISYEREALGLPAAVPATTLPRRIRRRFRLGFDTETALLESDFRHQTILVRSRSAHGLGDTEDSGIEDTYFDFVDPAVRDAIVANAIVSGSIGSAEGKRSLVGLAKSERLGRFLAELDAPVMDSLRSAPPLDPTHAGETSSVVLDTEDGRIWMDRHEVTNLAFAQFILEEPEWAPGEMCGRLSAAFANEYYLLFWRSFLDDGSQLRQTFLVRYGDHPVIYVSWFAAAAYCAWRTRKWQARGLLPKREPIYVFEEIDGRPSFRLNEQGVGFRLPSGREWEFACGRGASVITSLAVPEDLLQFRPSQTTEPVVWDDPNERGLYGVNTGVREWSHHAARKDGDGRICDELSRANIENHRGDKAILGGSYLWGERSFQPSFRSMVPGMNTNIDVGFRCVLVPADV